MILGEYIIELHAILCKSVMESTTNKKSYLHKSHMLIGCLALYAIFLKVATEIMKAKI